MEIAHTEQRLAWRPFATLRRVMLIAVGVAALVVAGYWFWLRDSGLVAVKNVTITGVTGSQAPAIRSALRNAALDMTTLHVSVGALRNAVGAFPLVADVRASADFPHGLRIAVIPHLPVAAVVVDGRRTATAVDGTLLRGVRAADDLPLVPVGVPPGGTRLTDERALAKLALLAAAPTDLRARVLRVVSRSDGLHAKLRSGPDLVFGTRARMRAKWVAAARVLADDRAVGATYIDVRIPERPVAGRFPSDSGSAAGAPPSTGAPLEPQTATNPA